MRKALALAAVLAGGVVVVAAVAVAGDNSNWTTHLQGRYELPVAVDSQGQGTAIFQLAKDGESMSYKLIASNIDNVTQAHIHLRSSATALTGGVVVWLYPSAPPAMLIPGRHDGILAEGTFTSANFVGALAGMSMEDLVAAMNAGLTYANVHTTAFPPGEIRGDID